MLVFNSDGINTLFSKDFSKPISQIYDNKKKKCHVTSLVRINEWIPGHPSDVFEFCVNFSDAGLKRFSDYSMPVL